MTTNDAVFLTAAYLRAFDLHGWQVRLIDSFRPGSPLVAFNRGGYCEVTARTIWLTKRGIENNAEARENIMHEIAHCLQPAEQFYDESMAHGPDFEKALERVREKDID